MVGVTAKVEREILLQAVDVREVIRVTCLGQLLQRSVGTGNVRSVVLAVVQLHDLRTDVRSQCGVVVVQFGKAVNCHFVGAPCCVEREAPVMTHPLIL